MFSAKRLVSQTGWSRRKGWGENANCSSAEVLGNRGLSEQGAAEAVKAARREDSVLELM